MTKKPGIHVQKTVTINRAPEDLYRFWRNFQNLPRFMKNLKSVTPMGEKLTHWSARAPLGVSLEWDSEITHEHENEFIAWRSIPGTKVENSGSVRFVPEPSGKGTEVKVAFEYNAPGGAVTAALARLIGEEPSQQVSEDLRRFKQLMETGEIATVEGQPKAS